MQMMENARYIRKELPNVFMPQNIRKSVENLCDIWVNTKHDVTGELFELNALFDSPKPTPDAIGSKCQIIQGMLFESIQPATQVVDALQEACGTDPDCKLALMLLMESVANVLNAIPSFPAIVEDAEPEADDMCEDDDDDESADHDCFGFHSEDSYPVGQIVDAIRGLLDRENLSTETIEQVRTFLFAMERLPLLTPGVRMGLALRLELGGESDWLEIRMEDEVFTLVHGAWIQGDAQTETIFEVGPGYRDGDAFQASNFAETFLQCAEDVCRDVVIDDSSDEPFNGWELEPGNSRWASLPCSFF